MSHVLFLEMQASLTYCIGSLASWKTLHLGISDTVQAMSALPGVVLKAREAHTLA